MSDNQSPGLAMHESADDHPTSDGLGGHECTEDAEKPGRTRGGTPISPEDEDFDGPPPRRPPEAAGVDPLPNLAGYDGSVDADLKLLSQLCSQIYRHSMRNLTAAEKVDPAGQLHERLGNQACKFASTARQLAATKASILKAQG